ncbi:MAG: thiamine pyrophosphate-dependent dehydrogenase E1 component subunit alpha [Deltaproteobacteria bacterium]|nr:thiamine pyrophosphate-dependent dehydrogenase E1 component subunit alpha [Deltaproteobacteria bacterium]
MLDSDTKLRILRSMITARALEERLIMMSKSADGFFWIGGPGEEAFNTCLGVLARPGATLDHDFFHFHYRNSATMVAMGMDPLDAIRQMAVRVTDPFTGGRNFCGHYCRRQWNVVPVTSTIQTQSAVATGTARAQKRHGGTGITITTSGDAGTAEGDFTIGLNWSTQPGWELPILYIVTNNKYGISTRYSEVHGHSRVADIAAGFGIESHVVDGNDVSASYEVIASAMQVVRNERRPVLIEAFVSRLHGHSSSSGGNRVPEGAEVDPLSRYAEQLLGEGLIESAQFDSWLDQERQRMGDFLQQAKNEPHPAPESIYDHIFATTEPSKC